MYSLKSSGCLFLNLCLFPCPCPAFGSFISLPFCSSILLFGHYLSLSLLGLIFASLMFRSLEYIYQCPSENRCFSNCLIFKLKLVFTRFWVQQKSWCCSFDININYCWILFSVHHPGSGVNYGILDPRTTQVKRRSDICTRSLSHSQNITLHFQASHLSLISWPPKNCVYHLQNIFTSRLLTWNCFATTALVVSPRAVETVLCRWSVFLNTCFYVIACLCIV